MTPDLNATLEQVAAVLANAAEPWWIIGSAAVELYDAATAPRDVDVLLSIADAHRLLPAIGLAAAAGRPDERFRSVAFARWVVPPVPVEFMAGLMLREEGAWRPVQPTTRVAHPVGGSRVYTPERSELVAILVRFGRAKDFLRAAALKFA